MRVLVTGATGFIGRHLVEKLASEHEVYALGRRLPAAPLPQVHYLTQELTQPLDRHQLPNQLDAIIHQAALIDTAGLDDTLPFLANVVGTWRLLVYAAEVGVQRFVHASTGGVYGCHDQPLREDDPPNPMDLYSLTKAQAELAVQAACGKFHKIVLRYFYPYGVGTPNPIPSYVQRALRGELIEVIEGGRPQLNPLHITDAVALTVQALALTQSATVNIAGTQVTSFAEIATLAAQQVGRVPKLRTIPVEAAIPYYRANVIGDVTRMQALFPVLPAVSLQDGITELVEYYRSATDQPI